MTNADTTLMLRWPEPTCEDTRCYQCGADVVLWPPDPDAQPGSIESFSGFYKDPDGNRHEETCEWEGPNPGGSNRVGLWRRLLPRA